MTMQTATAVRDPEVAHVDVPAAGQGRRSRRRIVVLAGRLVLAALLIGSWQLVVDLGMIARLYVSRPSDIATFLGNYISSGAIWANLGVTLKETVIGFLIGSGLGVAVGLLLSHFRILNDIANPFLTALNSLPRVALAPLFVLWFGIGQMPKILLAISLVFFIVLINTQAGVDGVPEELTMTAEVMGSTSRQRFIKVVLPSSIPPIFAALRLGIVYALLGAVVGEMLAAQNGLGEQVTYYSQTFNSAGLFAVLVVLIVIGLGLNGLALLLERYLMRWRRS